MDVNAYCLAKPDARVDFPFGPDAHAYRVHRKLFALYLDRGAAGSAASPRLNLKCEPEQALALRDIFAGVQPGYHMNKKHWNTIILDGSVPSAELERMIDHSYACVVRGLKRNERRLLELRYSSDQLYR